AENEVRLHEAALDVLLSMHQECGPEIDWHELAIAEQPLMPVLPVKPSPSNCHETAAREALSLFQPTFSDQLLGTVAERPSELEASIASDRQLDRQEYVEAFEKYKTIYLRVKSEWNEEQKDWEASRQLAARVLTDDPKAFIEAIERINPFAELKQLGSTLKFR